MPLLMHDSDSEVTILIDLPADRQVALTRQLIRSRESGHRSGFPDLIAQAVATAMSTKLDWDLLPPTEPQKSYAISISEGLGVEIPTDALRFRGVMSEFLTEHADRLKALQALKATAPNSTITAADLAALRETPKAGKGET